ncbi:hypothetical protein K490DRAFT_57512 [Saccharata proteae CBS 121410]|uniref:Uncharacterized protein n=1 Tax=Saccharata proteae CBS 121410 TaxID=1314787 RepID=A0A9P4LZ42_9PEZI|nr:hypothetical protein K490DRAFT_57512 [Saccharata proteae CBS 121410]
MLRRMASRLHWRANKQRAIEQKAVEEPVEDDWVEVEENIAEDTNCSPMEYIVPGPVEEAYQTARAEGTEAAQLAWQVAQDAYEVYLREHVNEAVEQLHDAARAAAMAAAARATRTLVTAIGTADAMEGRSLSDVLTEAFTRTRIGNDVYLAIDRYRYRRQQQIQALRDRVAVSFFRYKTRDDLIAERGGNANGPGSSSVVCSNNRDRNLLESSPPSSLPSALLPERQHQGRISNLELGPGQNGRLDDDGNIGNLDHKSDDIPDLDLENKTTDISESAVTSGIGRLSIDAVAVASSFHAGRSDATEAFPSPVNTFPQESTYDPENSASGSETSHSPRRLQDNAVQRSSSSIPSSAHWEEWSRLMAFASPSLDPQDDDLELEEEDLDEIYGMYAPNRDIGSPVGSGDLEAETSNGDFTGRQVGANKDAEMPTAQVKQVSGFSYMDVVDELKAKFASKDTDNDNV